ncbi:MAG: radical SAM protein [Aquificaceae bacterium]|nr:radical SAM protein [Aquificaceae bacterium]MDW8236879.1 radical SAM protein [Aquificaceae bacterium]
MDILTLERLTRQEQSPEYMQISMAAAMTLGLVPGSFYRNSRLGCINTLLTYPSGCHATCASCGLQKAREMEYSKKNFIRVEWPTVKLDEIISRSMAVGHVERLCIAQITHPRAIEDTKFVLDKVVKSLGEKLFVSLLINATGTRYEDIEDYHRLGADTVTVAIDCATKPVFEKLRGKPMKSPHRWEFFWQVLEWACSVMGDGHAGCHLVVGLGETEQEMIEAIQRVRDLGARTHLFSFWPEEGSMMEKERPCPAPQFRRVQMARYLIDNSISRYENMSFNERGQVIDFGVDKDTFEEVFNSARPFMTSGCRGKTTEVACNRPFGDSSVSDIKSFPFKPSRTDLKSIRKQLFDYEMRTNYPDVLNPSVFRYQ